jgi:hypothetical protein
VAFEPVYEKRVRFFPRTVLAACALFLAACDVCVEPAYEGKATDEAYLSLVDVEKTATADDSKAGLVFAPTGSVTLATAPTFEWTSGLTAHAAPKRLSPARPSLINELVFGTAHAHGTPMAGPGHLVRLKVQGSACPLQHFTSLTAWTPTGAEWQKLAEHKGKTLTIDVLSAYFTSNRVTEGPFKPSTPATVQLTP